LQHILATKTKALCAPNRDRRLVRRYHLKDFPNLLNYSHFIKIMPSVLVILSTDFTHLEVNQQGLIEVYLKCSMIGFSVNVPLLNGIELITFSI